MTDNGELANASIDELQQLVQAALAELADRPDVEAFTALLSMNGEVAESIGRSAQQLSASMSWAQIGDLAGTSRQNAWSRWSG